tara:strand:+ start:172 stop:1992 length:1821 start_codon:yes stop_codon:yes gene_type:complete
MNILTAVAVSTVSSSPPHIVFFMADDLGHGNVNFNRATPVAEVTTPNMDSLVASGVHLTRVYAYMFCSPTRAATLSGRLPIHVNVLNLDPSAWNATSGEGAGIATEMEGLGRVMQRGAYYTSAIGKWDAGMATPRHTPLGRGFNTSLVYFHHCIDYWSSTVSNNTDNLCSPTSQTIDWWRDAAPALERPTAGYTDELLASEAESVISRYATSIAPTEAARRTTPLFLYFASHAPHTPMQMPQRFLDPKLNIDTLSLTGQGYAAMVSVADEALGNVSAALKRANLWKDTLLIFQSDNGGPIYDNGWRSDGEGCPSVYRPGMTGPNGRAPFATTCLDFGGAANNFPLRGGKETNWEGGVRVAAFASGGFIPPARRGSVSGELMHAADWLATFSKLAGVDPTDAGAKRAGLPPIDSIDQSDTILLGTQGTRTNVVLGGFPSPRAIIHVERDVKNGSITALWKLLIGSKQAEGVSQASWTGPHFPNRTNSNTTDWHAIVENCSAGCLYDVLADPTEHVRRESDARIGAKWVAKLTAELEAVEATAFAPHRGKPLPAACAIYASRYSNHYGPFVPYLPPPPLSPSATLMPAGRSAVISSGDRSRSRSQGAG